MADDKKKESAPADASAIVTASLAGGESITADNSVKADGTKVAATAWATSAGRQFVKGNDGKLRITHGNPGGATMIHVGTDDKGIPAYAVE